MGFWIFMMTINLILPITMILLGRYYSRKAPKNINWVYGYRTPMSTKNKETWEFAHKYFGKLWYKFGIILLPVSIVAMLFVLGKSENIIGIVGEIICGVQVVLMVLVILPIEHALKKNFDKDGNRRITDNE